jgi:predicted ATP-binding protein involved in virulence
MRHAPLVKGMRTALLPKTLIFAIDIDFVMRIHELRLQNFRRFEDVTVPFPERFSVLVGDNGSGKTSVLDAVARVLNLFGLIKEDRNVGQDSDVRKVQIDNENRLQLPFHAGLSITVKDGRSFSPQVERFPESPDWIHPEGFFAAYGLELAIESRSRSGVLFPLMAYYGTGRLWGKSTGTQDWTRKDTEGFDRAYKECLSPNVSPTVFLGWFRAYEWEVMQFDQPFDKALLSCLKAAISEMVPDWQDIKYSFKDDGLFGTMTDEHGHHQRLDFRDLSDGYRGVIGMVADMAYRCIQLNPHLGENAVKETPGVVLIDELDLHLHPNWQRNIVADLKRVFPKVQFIATTHSPFIVQSLKPEELIILDDDAERGGDPRQRSVEEIASMEMGVDDVKRSASFMQMQVIAEQYLGLISNGHADYDEEQLKNLKSQLDALEETYASEPVFVAMLKLKRLGQGL